MRPEPRKRVDVGGNSTPFTKLDGAFAGVPPLPERAADAPPPATTPIGPNWKPGRVVLRRERARRGGKTVIVIDDFATHLPAVFIAETARKVRAACGCGGAVKGRAVEIQGDQAAKVRAVLEAEGFQVAGVS